MVSGAATRALDSKNFHPNGQSFGTHANYVGTVIGCTVPILGGLCPVCQKPQALSATEGFRWVDEPALRSAVLQRARAVASAATPVARTCAVGNSVAWRCRLCCGLFRICGFGHRRFLHP